MFCLLQAITLIHLLNKMEPPPYTPPYRALLLALRREKAEDDGAELRAALAQVTDWDELLRLARSHGVFPSLYRRLADTCPEAVPPAFLADLQRLYRALNRRNLRLIAALLKIIELFASHDIPAIPYKGPVLAAVAYGDIALRHFVDLDLLVPKKDLRLVKELLTREGYRLSEALTPQQERFYLRYTCEFTFEHPQKPMLDIHWRLAADYLGGGPDPDMMFRRRVPVSLEGKPVSSLAPEDMLLMLSLSSALDQWTTLGLVCDVARLVEARNSWDWPGLMARAGDLGMRRMLLLGLYLAHKLLAAPVPGEVAAQAEADPAVLALYQKVRERQLAQRIEDPGFLEMAWFELRVRERIRDRFTYFWVRATVPTVEDWGWVRLPDSFFWLYFFLRPLRLLVHGVLRPTLQRWCRISGGL
jgi:hypothetical protein